jgi:hypothetical protein
MGVQRQGLRPLQNLITNAPERDANLITHSVKTMKLFTTLAALALITVPSVVVARNYLQNRELEDICRNQMPKLLAEVDSLTSSPVSGLDNRWSTRELESSMRSTASGLIRQCRNAGISPYG